MPFVDRDSEGHITANYANAQRDGHEFVEDADAELYVPPPKSVTKRQAREALIRNGMIAGVEAAIDNISDPLQRAIVRNDWDSSQVFERNRPTLLQLAAMLGMNSAQLDAMFAYAATL